MNVAYPAVNSLYILLCTIDLCMKLLGYCVNLTWGVFGTGQLSGSGHVHIGKWKQ